MRPPEQQATRLCASAGRAGQVTLKFQLSDERPCRLKRGELRRLPYDSQYPVIGYYLCCPGCGFVTLALDGANDLVISETSVGDRGVVTFSRPIRCICCSLIIHLTRNDGRLVEDEHVRHLHYR